MTILTCDEYANISYEEMEKAVRKNTRAIICTHASNMTGNMISLESVGKIAAKYGILFIVDVPKPREYGRSMYKNMGFPSFVLPDIKD